MYVPQVLVLVAAFLAIQVNTAEGTPTGGQLRDVFDTAEALLQDLQESVDVALSEAVPQFNLMRNQVYASANSVLATAKSDLFLVKEAIKQEVDDFRDQAEAAGADLDQVDECIEEFNVESLPDEISTEITICINVTVGTIIDMMDSSMVNIQATQTEVDKLSLNIAQCKLLPEPDNISCITRVIENISIQIVNLPARIQEDTDRTKAVVRALIATFQECADDRIPSAPIVGQQIIGYIRQCVNQKPNKTKL